MIFKPDFAASCSSKDAAPLERPQSGWFQWAEHVTLSEILLIKAGLLIAWKNFQGKWLKNERYIIICSMRTQHRNTKGKALQKKTTIITYYHDHRELYAALIDSKFKNDTKCLQFRFCKAGRHKWLNRGASRLLLPPISEGWAKPKGRISGGMDAKKMKITVTTVL